MISLIRATARSGLNEMSGVRSMRCLRVQCGSGVAPMALGDHCPGLCVSAAIAAYTPPLYCRPTSRNRSQSWVSAGPAPRDPRRG